MTYTWYEQYDDDEKETKGKRTKARNTAFLNEDAPANKFFKRKKKKVIKKSQPS